MVQTFATRTEFEIPFRILCPVYFLRYPNPIASHVLSVDVLSREILVRPRQRIGDASRAAEQATAHTATAGQDQEQDNDTVHILKTTRLILKKGTLPKWAPKGLIRNAESWVLEESEVELDGPAAVPRQAEQGSSQYLSAASLDGDARTGRTMRSWTRNLDHTTVMAVTEGNIFTEQRGTPSSSTGDIFAKKHAQQGSISLLDTAFVIQSGIGFSLLRNRIEKFGFNRVVTHVDSSRQGILSTYERFLHERGLGALSARSVGGQVLAPPSALPSKRQRLLAALRPPFLDGDFVGPVARFKKRWGNVRTWWKGLERGGTGDEDQLGVRRSSGGAIVDMAPQRRLNAITQDAGVQDAALHRDALRSTTRQERPARSGVQSPVSSAENARDEDTLTPMELLRKRILHLRNSEQASVR